MNRYYAHDRARPLTDSPTLCLQRDCPYGFAQYFFNSPDINLDEHFPDFPNSGGLFSFLWPLRTRVAVSRANLRDRKAELELGQEQELEAKPVDGAAVVVDGADRQNQ